MDMISKALRGKSKAELIAQYRQMLNQWERTGIKASDAESELFQDILWTIDYLESAEALAIRN